jgi:hypothetical protein
MKQSMLIVGCLTGRMSLVGLISLIGLIGLMGLMGCARDVAKGIKDFRPPVAELLARVPEGRKVAVSAAYNAKNGEINALGDYYRGKIETAINHARYKVIPREETLLVLFNEHEIRTTSHIRISESPGTRSDPRNDAPELGADVVLSIRYYLVEAENRLELQIRALNPADNKIVGAISLQERLPTNWRELAAVVHSNIFGQKLESLAAPAARRPSLQAQLDRTSACYPAGADVRLQVETEVGVHLYIFNLAADNSVTLVYPNRYLPDLPLEQGRFHFPPKGRKDMTLEVYPLVPHRSVQETFKIVASGQRLDFGFLPVPINAIFSGVEGGDLQKVLETLNQARGWAETTLTYRVGPQCGR